MSALFVGLGHEMVEERCAMRGVMMMKRTRTTKTTTSMGVPVSIKMANYLANKRRSRDMKRGRERGESWTTKQSNSVSVSPPASKEIS